MENSTMRNMYSSLPPKIPFSKYDQNGSKGMISNYRDGNSVHQRISSEMVVMEEQPSWVDELLDEPETETPVKMQCGQRSRVRKLQYIAKLERNVQALQAEGYEVSGDLRFLNQTSLILTKENKSLKQRLENLAQEQLIKLLEQEVLEREIGRLKAVYKQQQQQQSPRNQRLVGRGHTNGQDNMESQFSNLALNSKEPGAVSGSHLKNNDQTLCHLDDKR